jgi:small subunit ribosomal protein S15
MYTETRENTLESFRLHDKDVGSIPLQIALLTQRINFLSGHFAKHPKDKHSRTGLIKMVNRRRKSLKYLRRTTPEAYKTLIGKLELRK